MTRYGARMPRVTSAATHAPRHPAADRPTATDVARAQQRRRAAAADVLWRSIFGTVEPTTPLGRTIACDVAAAHLDELGLLADAAR